MLLCGIVAQAQDAKDILLQSKAACEKVKNASFNSEVYFKFFNRNDTLHFSGRLHLSKVDTNESGVIGRMDKLFDKKHYVYYLSPTFKATLKEPNNLEMDTVYFKNGFEGNIHNELFNSSIMKIEPFRYLSDSGNQYKLLSSNPTSYTIAVNIKSEDGFDQRKSKVVIDKKTMLPIEFQNSLHDIKQDQIQYRKINITHLSINDDSASYYLNKLNIATFDTVTYTKPYIAPPLLDSASLAPNWKFPVYGSIDSLSLSDLKGKYVLLDFWYIACHPCQLAIPSLVNLQAKYKDKLVVVGMNPFDTDDKLKPFIPRNQISYKVVKCNYILASALYHVSGYPTMYLINPEGVIIKTHVGFAEDKVWVEAFEKEIGELIR